MLFTLSVFSLLSSLNDASVDIVDDEGSFEFSPKAGVTLESPHFTQVPHSAKSMLKRLVLKCVLNYLLLETECPEVW